MVERVFAEQTLSARVIHTDQARDHRLRRSGLCICDGLLKSNAAGTGIKRDVRQPKAFDATLRRADAGGDAGSAADAESRRVPRKLRRRAATQSAGGKIASNSHDRANVERRI